MTSNKERALWSLAAGSAAIVAGFTTRMALNKSWRKIKGFEPPENPDSSEVSWSDALLWTALTGAAVGISQLVATRLTAGGWRKFHHKSPPKGR